MPLTARLRATLGALLGSCQRHGWLSGLTAALALIAIGAGGGLRWLENPLHDAQVRWFGTRADSGGKPGAIAYFEIDDAALATTGRWPWPRAVLADAIREMDRAGASVIALDLLLDEAQETRYPEAQTPGSTPVPVHDDAVLAQTLRQNARTVLAARVAPAPQWDEGERWTLDQLLQEPLLTGEALALRAKAAKRNIQSALQSLPSLKREALRLGVLAWRAKHPSTRTDLEACRKDLLGRDDGVHHQRLESAFLDAAWSQNEAMETAMRHWPTAAAAGEPTRLIPPILPLAKAAGAVSGAPWSPDADGVVRSCLLATPVKSGFAPTLPVMAVCLHLGVAPEKMRLDGDHWVLPRQGKPDIRIPLLEARAGEAWGLPGPRAPVVWGAGNPSRQPVGPLVELARLDADVRHNEMMADRALITIATLPDSKVPVVLLGDDGLRPIIDLTTDDPALLDNPEMAARRAELHQKILAALAATGTDPGPAWRAATHQAEEGRLATGRLRNQLRLACQGKICILGWTATGSLADFVTTPLGARVPGMYVQGAIAQTLLSQTFITRAPLWVEMLLSLLAAALLCHLAWRKALLFSTAALLVLSAGLFAAGGWLGLGVNHLRVDGAMPLAACLAGWTTCMLLRSALYQKQKQRITAQFRNYVSPSLVDHLVAHPELAEMKSESREITCVFTDFAGFTTVSTQLDAGKTALLLNRYLAAATGAFMAHGGNVNKFMGDGILVFWGAPLTNPNQALDACRGICACRQAMAKLADDPALAGLPPLFLRAGATTGQVMVGDFGAPPARSDYTVIGDSVNLASRLESANKHLGTATLVGEKTARQAEAEFLLRPIARLKVVGRDMPETVFELLGPKAAATAEQHAALARAQGVVEAFTAGHWQECLARIALAQAAEPGAKWLALYQAACRAHQENTGMPHDGSLTLGQK